MVGDHAVDEAIVLLALAVDGLRVMARVPRGVEHNDAIRADQIDAQAAGARREPERARRRSLLC